MSEESEKWQIIHLYFPPSEGILCLLLIRLPKEKLKEVCEKYAKKMNYEKIELVEEVFALLGYAGYSGEDFPNRDIFTYNEMVQLQEHLASFWINEELRTVRKFLRSAESKEAITKAEHEKLTKVYNDFRGSKIATKNRERYKEVIAICEQDFINKGLGEQWSNAVGVYASKNHYNFKQREKLYKSFMRWRSGKTIEKMKNLLS